MTYTLDKTNALFLGLCAGFAKMTGTDPLWWRLGAAVGTLFGFVLLPVIYLLIAWLAQPKIAHDA